MKFNRRIALAIVCASLAACSCLVYAQEVRKSAIRQAQLGNQGQGVSVLCATQNLERGHVLTAADMRLVEVPEFLVSESTLRNQDELIGKTLQQAVSMQHMYTHDDIRTAPSDQGVPAGRVAISIPFNDKLGIPSHAEAGLHLAAFEVQSQGVRLLASDVEVVGIHAEKQGAAGAKQINIALSSSDIPRVLMASSAGTLRFVLPADDVVDFKIDSNASKVSDVQPVAEGDDVTHE